MGISIADLENLLIGEIFDIVTERGNDDYEYPYIADKDDIARFRDG